MAQRRLRRRNTRERPRDSARVRFYAGGSCVPGHKALCVSSRLSIIASEHPMARAFHPSVDLANMESVAAAASERAPSSRYVCTLRAWRSGVLAAKARYPARSRSNRSPRICAWRARWSVASTSSSPRCERWRSSESEFLIFAVVPAGARSSLPPYPDPVSVALHGRDVAHGIRIRRTSHGHTLQ